MRVKKLTKEEILNHSVREYNATEWSKIIDRFNSYANIQFYIEIESAYSYDRFFATYTLPEGFSVFTSVSYSSMLSNNGFVKVQIDEDGTVHKILFSNGKTTGRAENTKANRELFAKKNLTVSNCI